MDGYENCGNWMRISLMADTLCTYFSKNSPAGKEWMGFISFDGNRLDISFTASTEEEVKQKMRDFYAKDKAVRDANRAKAAENKAKRVAALKAKKGDDA